jgi:hypothetical protein
MNKIWQAFGTPHFDDQDREIQIEREVSVAGFRAQIKSEIRFVAIVDMKVGNIIFRGRRVTIDDAKNIDDAYEKYEAAVDSARAEFEAARQSAILAAPFSLSPLP